jgi:hypothetical protein
MKRLRMNGRNESYTEYTFKWVNKQTFREFNQIKSK